MSPSAWNVLMVSASASALPTRSPMRSRISSAALLVNDRAQIAFAGKPRSRSRATRYVITRVLPEPAPASTSSAPSPCTTASRCGGFSPDRSSMSEPRYGFRAAK
jgi:hypothetical protein